VALVELAEAAPQTRVAWVTRGEPAAEGGGPIALFPGDRLAERDALARRANRIAAGHPAVTHLAGTTVDAVRFDAATGAFRVRLTGAQAGEHEFDRVVANVGYRPDNRLYGELHVHECYATGGPMKLAAALAGHTSADCLDQPAAGPAALVTPEPDFYILGSKSYGRDSRFLIAAGLAQVRDVFTILCDRPGLDLYATAHVPVRE
jgi:hypothetical protein